MQSFKQFITEDINDDMSKKLHASTLGKIDPKTYVDLMHYTSTSGGKPVSSRINRALVNGHELNGSDKAAHETILKKAKPAGHEVHLYSGVGTDPRTRLQGNVFHAKAHLSTSHDPFVAMDFSKHERVKKTDHNHVMHIHTTPRDKILHVSRISKHPMEHESIVPAGTKLKYHSTSIHDDGADKYHVHHFTFGESHAE